MSNESIQKMYRFVSWSLIYALVIPAFCTVIPELLRSGKPDLKMLGYLWNHMLTYRYALPVFLFLYIFLLLLSLKLSVPTLILPLISLAFGTVSYDLINLRGTPLLPSDFANIINGIVALAKGYKIRKPPGIWTVVIIIAVLWFITLFARIRTSSVKKWVKVLLLIFAIGSLVGCVFYCSSILSDADILSQLGRVDSAGIADAFEKNGFFPEFFARMFL